MNAGVVCFVCVLVFSFLSVLMETLSLHVISLYCLIIGVCCFFAGLYEMMTGDDE